MRVKGGSKDYVEITKKEKNEKKAETIRNAKTKKGMWSYEDESRKRKRKQENQQSEGWRDFSNSKL